jgi:hypothetical protein
MLVVFLLLRDQKCKHILHTLYASTYSENKILSNEIPDIYLFALGLRGLKNESNILFGKLCARGLFVGVTLRDFLGGVCDDSYPANDAGGESASPKSGTSASAIPDINTGDSRGDPGLTSSDTTLVSSPTPSAVG